MFHTFGYDRKWFLIPPNLFTYKGNLVSLVSLTCMFVDWMSTQSKGKHEAKLQEAEV